MIYRFTIISIIFWTLLIGGSLAYNVDHAKTNMNQQVNAEAQAILSKDITFRRWGTRHGGVYVPITQSQQPIPFMAHVPGRDVTTTDGLDLTLINPASMLRQMMDDYEDEYGVRGRITGLKFLNSANAPDEWEAEQLQIMSSSPGDAEEIWKTTDINGIPHLRYLRPMIMESGCMKCHGHLGYKIGEVRGATGINLPLTAYLKRFSNIRFNLIASHLLVWLVVLVAITWIGRKASRQEDDLANTVQLRTAELERSRDAAQAGLVARESFIANMSHEIRTPMNAILGFSEIVSSDTTLPAKTKQKIKTIHSSANNLLSILNDILDLTKLESGKLKVESIPFNLKNMISDVKGLHLGRITEKGLSFQVDIDPSVAARVIGDPTRLRQVLVNLLDNAIKFTESGCICLRISVDSASGLTHFELADTGIGMTEHQATQVFDPFHQADQSTTRLYGGTGLGTSICKQLVEAMGGKIWVETLKNKGSTFHFTLKYQPAAANIKCLFDDDGPTTNDYHSPRCFRVLIAEDVKTNADLLKIWLDQQGHSPHWVKNGAEAVEAYQENDYDLVLMDIHMPIMDGLEASAQIRELEQRSGIQSPVPIIALTASVMREDIDKCNAAGMTAVASKPIAINKLLVLMEDSVEAGRGRPNNRTELNLDPESDDDFTTVAAIADPKKARASWKTLSAYIRALQAFVSHHDTTLDDLRQYLAERPRKDTDALSLLHALRGAASNLQLSTIADASQQLETVIRAENYDRQQELFTHLKCAVDKAFTAIGKLASFDDSGPKNLEITQDPLMIEPLFKKLFAALDELDPELADPILKDLRRYLTKSDLAGIENALGTFDFGKAKDAAAALIQQFKLQPSPAR